MPRYEVYSFSKHKCWGGFYTNGVGYLKESFEDEKLARDYRSVMSKSNPDHEYRIKQIEEGWLTY